MGNNFFYEKPPKQKDLKGVFNEWPLCIQIKWFNFIVIDF